MPRWSRKRMTWIIVGTILATIVVVVVAINFATPEKKLERTVTHHYAIGDPQFRREMSVMMGPSVMPGNRAATSSALRLSVTASSSLESRDRLRM